MISSLIPVENLIFPIPGEISYSGNAVNSAENTTVLPQVSTGVNKS